MDYDYSIHYKKWNSTEKKHVETKIRYYKQILASHLGKNKKIKILDIGSGMGFSILALESMGYNDVLGIDIDKSQVNNAKKIGANVQMVSNSNHFLKNSSSKYDLILAFDLIEHINKNQQIPFVKLIYSSLNKNGKFLFTVPNSNSTFGTRWRYLDWTHEIGFTEESIDFLLANAGFKGIQISEIEFVNKPKFPHYSPKKILFYSLFKFVRFFRRLEAIGELGIDQGKKIPLSLNLFGVARK